MGTDSFAGRNDSVTMPASSAVAVTPHDTNELTVYSRGLYVGVSGNVAVIPVNGSSAVTFVGLAAGIIHPIRAKVVLSTGTTATSIVAVY